jgi:hypothetical protein
VTDRSNSFFGLVSQLESRSIFPAAQIGEFTI